MSKLCERFENVNDENQVSDIYKEYFRKYFNFKELSYFNKCDGYLEGTIKYDKSNHIIKLLMEFKKEENFYDKKDRCKVVLQAIYYIKHFFEKSVSVPEVLLISDKKTCFIMSVNDIISYLDLNIDWSIAPSRAYEKNKDVIEMMINDDKINPFIFRINDSFDFKEIVIEIESMAKEISKLVEVNEKNIIIAYDYFVNSVISNMNSYKADELVQIFIALLTNPDDNITNKENTKLFMASGKRVDINGENFTAYFKRFKNVYKPSEVRKLTAISDRLVEDTFRKKRGEYYTPTIWANEAHRYIENILGVNWKNQNVVWDSAWGTGNLTRDYKFKNLFCSTIDSEDLIIGEKYNGEATKFQYDFLNDDIGDLFELGNYINLKMPCKLIEPLEDKKSFVFFINPPFAESGSGGAKGTSKKGVSNTIIKSAMLKDGMGKASQQVYIQFLYRIINTKVRYGLSNITIAFFSTPIFLTGENFKSFREIFLKHFSYKGGFLFNASNFAGVKKNWGITFSIWNTEISEFDEAFKFDILDFFNGELKKTGEKIFYNCDKREAASKWIRKETEKMKTFDAPQFINGIDIKERGNGRVVKDSLGYAVNSANNINENATYVFITSSTSCKGHGVPIIKENLMKVVSNYSARKLMTKPYSNWINIKDEYLKPNVNHEKYSEWNNDALIYSLFSNGSIQSSLRNVEYKDKIYDIANNFFFESKEIIKEYADDNYNISCYNDADIADDEAYVYKLINTIKFSKEAEAVLLEARRVLKDTFKYRKEFNKRNSKYQVNNWDAGWYQIKMMLNDVAPKELDKFKELFKILENKMRPLIYELEFLI